jgi:site-specific DNA recombinase
MGTRAATRAATYLRISQDETGDEAGVSRQREDVAELIERREWSHVREFKDNDRSAAGNVVREDFVDLLAAIERGEIDVIVAWSLDRLVRTARDRLALVETCQRHGVTVALVRGSDLDPTTPGGRLTLGILGEVAQHEIDQKSDRQKRAHVQLAAQGKPWCSRRPFGYETGGMRIRPDEARHLRTAYKAVLAGASVRGVAARWNDAGIKTSTGGQWHGASVRQLLLNPRYAAIRAHGEEEIGPAAWKRIVDEPTYRAVKSVLTDPSRRVGAGRERKYLLTGIARCGRCGEPMGSGRATSTGQRTYTCKRHHHLSRAGEPVDGLVTRVVLALLSRPDAAAVFADSAAPDTADLATEAMTLRARLDALAVEFADGSLTASQLRAATERLRARLADVETRMVSTSRGSVLDGLVGAQDVAAAWDALSLDRRRAVVDVLCTVTILPASKGRGFDPSTVKITPKT